MQELPIIGRKLVWQNSMKKKNNNENKQFYREWILENAKSGACVRAK